jgi:outer membrane protein TolC
MKKTLFFAILFALGFSTYAQPKEIKAFTVNEAVSYALQNNNAVKNAKLGVDQAKWRNLEIYTTGLPQIAANFDYTYYFKTPISPALGKAFSSGALAEVFQELASTNQNIRDILSRPSAPVSFVLPHNINTGLSVNQLLFDGRYIFGIKAAKDLMLTARLTSQMSDFETKYAVMKAYYQALGAMEAKGLLEENLKIIDKLASDTRATYNAGLIEETDADRLELAKANLESQIALQNQLSEVAVSNLKFQMGMSLSEEIILKDNLTELKAQLQPDFSTQFDPKKRIEYNLLEEGIKLKGFDMRQKRVQYYPSLYGFLNYGWQSQAQNGSDVLKRDSWYDQGFTGISLKVPIFDSGLKLAQVRQAKIEQQKTMNDFENFKNASELQYRAAQSSFASALTDEANMKRAQALSKKIFDRTSIKYKEGVGNSFELQQSQQDLATNNLKFIQSSLNLLNTKADLDKALGKQ